MKHEVSFGGVLLLLGTLGLYDISAFAHEHCGLGFALSLGGAVALSFIKALVLWACWRVACRLASPAWRRVAKGVCGGVTAVYALLCVANFLLFEAYGFGITRHLLTILSQTDARETWTYLPSLCSALLPRLVAVTAGALAVGALPWVAERVGVKRVGHRRWILGLALVVAVPLAYPLTDAAQAVRRTNLSLTLRTALAFYEKHTSQQRLAAMLGANRRLPQAESVTCRDEAPLSLVLVIGESTDRRHCSAYGYGRDTNRFTRRLGDGLLAFTDVISPFCGTGEALSRLLTFMDDAPTTDHDRWADFPDVVQVMRAAGVHTYWWSNQQRLGRYLDCTTPIGEECDRKGWLVEFDQDVTMQTYDAALLPWLDESLADDAARRFVVLHTMGAHPTYRHRYPATLTGFSGGRNATVDEYDTAVLYADSLVAEVCRRVEALPTPAVAVYVSDHGQNVYDTADSFGHNPRHVEVPMFLYANKAYRAAHADRFAALRAHRTAPATTSQLIHTLCGLAEISYAACQDTLDLGSARYRLTRRYANRKPYWPHTRAYI